MAKSTWTQNDYPHLDSNVFRTIIEESAKETGFLQPLIEKDYFCSLILKEVFSDKKHALIFKGGTLLNKVYAGFYRLSEDLDFSISITPTANRKQRSNLAKSAKEQVNSLNIEGVTLQKPLKGSNNSRQYNAEFQYRSCLSPSPGKIAFEVALRNKTILAPLVKEAGTLAIDPFSAAKLIEPFEVRCLSLEEAYAEKLRAALSRKKPAIRDIFDIHYAQANNIVQFDHPRFRELVSKVMLTDGGRESDVSASRKKQFEAQLTTELQPVLRHQDFNQFDFNSAWKKLSKLSKMVSSA